MNFCISVSAFDIDDGDLCRGLICSSHSQVSCLSVNQYYMNYLVKLNRIVDLTNPWGPHFTVQVANFPFNLISCSLTEFLKRWQFSGFTAHCFTDKHAIHNVFRSSGIQKSAKHGEPRFGRGTSHPETELGQKSTVCQRLICPGFL